MHYRDAGVDTRRADQLIEHIRTLNARPLGQGGIGGFAALCPLPSGLHEPLLVSCTDGVGTKLCLARTEDEYRNLGQDLVAMCVNDLITCGAKPLQFQDYYACGRIEPIRSKALLEGISSACARSGCVLAGGETAEMPGVYPEQGFDLAGFCLGVVERSQLIDGHTIRPGDLILGLTSSGLHSNGYSLVRRVLEQHPVDEPLRTQLLAPTRLYPDLVQRLRTEFPLKGLAHITGGGLAANLARILPAQTGAELDLRCWQRPALFHWLQQQGPIGTEEMLATFNCGLGMLLIIAPEHRARARRCLEALNEPWLEVGLILPTEAHQPHVAYRHLDAF